MRIDDGILIRVLIRRQGSFYVASSVDYDVVAQSKRQEDLASEFCSKFIAIYEGYEQRGMDMAKVHPKADPDLICIYNESIPTRWIIKPTIPNLKSEPEARVEPAAV